jgi:hypothetical protein
MKRMTVPLGLCQMDSDSISQNSHRRFCLFSRLYSYTPVLLLPDFNMLLEVLGGKVQKAASTPLC